MIKKSMRMRSRLPTAAMLFVACSSLPTLAQVNYTVNVTSELNGLDIKIEPVSNAGLLVVNLTNGTDGKVKCIVSFQADPQVPNRSFVFIEPGKRSSATLRATQRWYEVDVDVNCKPDG